MAQNNNISSLDVSQMQKHMFDASNDAQRVILVGGEGLIINAEVKDNNDNAPRIIEVEKPIIIKEKEIVYVDRPVIVQETKIEYVDRPVIIKEPVYIDRPVVIERAMETKIEYVDRPVIVKQTEVQLVDKPAQNNKIQILLAVLLGLQILIAVINIVNKH